MTNTPTSLQIYKASAGSGKTFTLAVEYISLLAINPMAYQNILAVTFTNKATAEMKQRILSTLYGIAHSLPSADGYVDNILRTVKRIAQTPSMTFETGSANIDIDQTTLRKRAKDALSNIIHDYSRFHIETIDSFFQGILREIANELDLPTNISVEIDQKQVLAEAVDKIIYDLKEDSIEFRSIIDFIEEKIHANASWKVEDTVKDFGENIFKENYLIHGEEVRRKITNISKIYIYRKEILDFVDKKKPYVTDLAKQMLDIINDIDFLSNAENIRYILDSFVGKLGDVAEAFLSREDFNEGAEINDSLYSSMINLSTFRLFDDCHDKLLCFLSSCVVLTIDHDCSVIIDVDFRTTLFSNGSDCLSACTDDSTDLILWYLK